MFSIYKNINLYNMLLYIALVNSKKNTNFNNSKKNTNNKFQIYILYNALGNNASIHLNK